MDARQRELLIKELNEVMTRHDRMRTVLHEALQEFSTKLFAALERVLSDLQAANVPGIGKFRRLTHPAAREREAFQCFIEDWSIIFVPLPGIARPNAKDEALIAPYLFKQPCGRIGVFLNDDPAGTAFYDFLLFDDRSWFAWGYGWPRQQALIADTDFEALALELIVSFAKDIFTTWYPRDETKLGEALDAKRRCFVFGLPGEDQR